LVTDSHIILVGGGADFFSQLLDVRGVNDVRQTKIHTAEPLVPEPSAFEFEMAIEYLVRPKSPGTDQIPAELITGGKKIALRSLNSLIRFGIRRNCLRSGRSRSWYLCTRSAIKQIVVITEAYHFCLLRSKFCPTSFCQSQPHMQKKLLGIINVDFEATGQLLVLYSAFVTYLGRNGNRVKQCIISL
jgi:hypothetical protein